MLPKVSLVANAASTAPKKLRLEPKQKPKRIKPPPDAKAAVNLPFFALYFMVVVLRNGTNSRNPVVLLEMH